MDSKPSNDDYLESIPLEEDNPIPKALWSKKRTQIAISLGLLLLLGFWVGKKAWMYRTDVEGTFVESVEHWPALLIALFSTLLAIAIRARRWFVMLGKRGSIALAFRSVAIGYLVYLFLHRIGEFARVANYKSHSDCSVGRLLSTMFIDRMLDVMIFLFMLLGCSLYAMKELNENFPDIMRLVPSLSFMMGVMLVAMVFFLFARNWLAAWVEKSTWLPERLRGWMTSFIHRFAEGLEYVRSPAKILYLIATSLAIWTLYFITFYAVVAPFSCFEGKLDVGQGFFAFVCVTVGVLLAPTPGAVGFYHECATKGLGVMTTGISPSQLYGIAIFTHFYIIYFMTFSIGASCWIYQILSPSKKKICSEQSEKETVSSNNEREKKGTP